MTHSHPPRRRSAPFTRAERGRKAKRSSRTQRQFESLEARQMLDASFVVSELMALNSKTIRDEDLAYSDWIEIRNDGDAAGNLGGHYLTNNLGNRTQWQFPANVTLNPGEHLVVFASGKNRLNADEPHTNFTLDHNGGDVALVAPNGSTIVSQLADYPALVSDQSYGLIRRSQDADYIGNNAPSRILVPANNNLGTTWQGGNEPFSDASWTAGTGAIGYDVANGAQFFNVQIWYSTTTIVTLANADAAIAGQNVTPQSPFVATPQTINYKDDPDAGDGNFASGIVFPGNTAGDNNNFVMKATTSFFIRPDQAGLWTFGFNSDDGGRVRVDGTNVIVDDTNHGPTDFFGTINLTAGLHTIEYTYWEQGGGAEAELFAAPGLKTAFDASFSLIGTPGGALPLGSLDDLIVTDIETAMLDENASAYVRYPFAVTNAADVQLLTFHATFDDGYAAYLNGTLVASANAPGSLTFDSAAVANGGIQSATLDLSAHRNLLHDGQNILAVQGLNSTAGDEEFFLDIGLSARVLGQNAPEVIDLPTPGAANGIIEPLITEFQASNRGTISDEDGDSSDWIEIHNPGSVDVNLGGWYLTDDPLVPTKWQFPSTRIEAGGYLVVFASDKNRATFGEELHTNFKIAQEGDYIALVRPDGSAASAYEPGGGSFTPQFDDVSYGLRGNAVGGPVDEEEFVGLVAYWDFEDGPGSTVLTDRSGNGRHGTLVNMDPATDWVAGNVGTRALDFDGVNDTVTTLATAADLDITGKSKRTIAGWVRGKTVGTARLGSVFEVGTGTGEFGLHNSSTVGNGWLVEQGNQSTSYLQASANVWHHVAVVYDGANTVVYINGVEKNPPGPVPNAAINTGGAGVFNFGRRAATNLFFSGIIDDFAVWDMALPASVIASLNAKTMTPLQVPTINRNIGTSQAGFTVRQVNASASFPGIVTGEIGGGGAGANPLADADELLSLPSGHAGIASQAEFNYNEINFRDPDGGGSFGNAVGDDSFPLDAELVDENHFAVIATASLVVPAGAEGEFAFGVHADDGARLKIDGVTVVLDNTANGAAALSTGTRTLTAGVHTLELVYFERTGGAELELFYKSRSGGQDNAAFELLTVVKGEQLPPPPVTIFDAERAFFPTPTPGSANNVGVEVFVGPTSFSIPRGFYTSPQQVSFINATLGVQIYYTTNGTDPYTRNPTTGVITATGTLWNGTPLNVSTTTVIRAAGLYPGAEPSKVATATYLFTSDIITQQANGAAPPGWPACTGNAMSYGMDPAITGNATWGPQMDAALKQIPSMSIVTDLANLCDPTNGIYNHAGNRGAAWERPVSLEMIVPDGYQDPIDPFVDQSGGFQVNAGLRIRGGFSRDANNPKHSFRVFFRGEYGDSRLNFPLFGDEGADSFDGFDFRTSQNYSWNGGWGSGPNTFARDEVSRLLMGDMGQEYTRGRYYHLYINGIYWGIYESEERPEADFAESYMGGSEEDYDVVKNDPRLVGTTDGNTDAYMRLFNAFNQAGGLSDANLAEYYEVQGMNPDGTRNPNYERLLDVENLMDYMILTYYTSASDGPGSKFTRPQLNNWFAIFNRENPDGFQHMAHDFEHSFDTGNGANAGYNMVVPFVNNCGNATTFNPHCQHEVLMETNGVYAQQFIDRVNELFFDEGVLSAEHVLNRIEFLTSQIDVAIIAEAARWGDSGSRSPSSWISAVQGMRDWVSTTRFGTGGAGRVHEVIDQFRAVGWYPQVGAPIITPNGGNIDEETEISINVPGTVVFNDTTIINGANGATTGKWLVPSNADVDSTWYTTGFNDATWSTGALGISYKDNNGALDNPLVTSTNVGSPAGAADVPVYVRVPFTMTSTNVDSLILRMNYDDGFIAYLNGFEVARRNYVGTPTFTSVANAVHNADPNGAFEDINITSFKHLLNNGNNLLAVHALNSAASSDLFIQPALVSRTQTTLDGAGQVYYTTDGSDPRAPNGTPSPTSTSYNAVQDFLTGTSAGKYRVATGAALETGWQNRTYNDSTWTNAVGSVGYDTGAGETIGGFEVRIVDTTAGTFANVDQATAVLNGITTGFTVGNSETRAQPYVNHGDAGNLTTPSVLSVFATPDREQYAIRATSNITIPVGTWTIAVGSDDGFRVTIPGVTFTSRFNADASAANVVQFSAPRGHAQTGGTFTVTGSPLVTTITLDFYEAGGGDSVELSLAAGQQTGFAVGTFNILQDGQNGWAVKTTGTNVNYSPLVTTNVQTAMLNQGSSLYVRYPFNVADVSLMQNLTMSMAYDDGFVAYLNGIRVASRAAPTTLAHTSVATGVRSDAESTVREFFDLSTFMNQLVNGQNVLAIHVLNASANNPDLLASVELEGTFGGQPFTLTENSVVKARAFLNGEWSALSQEFFVLDDYTLAISEIHFHPTDATPAEISAGFNDSNDFEFIEIVNTGTKNVNLAGVAFVTGITFNFSASPVQVLSPGERVVIVDDLNAFLLRYGSSLPSGIKIAGAYGGNLSSQGELLTLVDGLGGVVQSFEFGDNWHESTDGLGFSLTIRDEHADPATWGDSSAWRPSSVIGGTPGSADDFTGILSPGDLVVNELLAATTAANRRVELLNRTNAPIDISGWYVSNDPNDVKKYQLPNLPPIAPGEFRVLSESALWGAAFQLTALGGDFVLHAAEGTTLVGFGVFRDYDATEDGTVLGRHVNSSGDSDFTTLISPTFGSANAAPKVGPIVINEIHYHPQDDGAVPPVGGDEFIELVNTSAAPVSLLDWEFATGITYVFGNVTLAPGELLVLTNVTPAQFAANPHNATIPAGVKVLGPYAGSLDNTGENVELFRPGENATLYLADRVEYNDVAPWPTLADGTGPSLSKTSSSAYGNDPINWANGSNDGTPGSANSSSTPGDFNSDGQINAVDIDTIHAAINAGLTNPFYDLDGNSLVNAADATYLIETILGTRRGDANLDGDVNRADMATIARNYGFSGSPSWAKGDFDGNGQVDLADLARAQPNMGFSAPSPAAPAAVITAVPDGAARVATHRDSAAVRVLAPRPSGVDHVMSASDGSSSTTLRVRSARHRAAIVQTAGSIDLSAIADEVRRIRRS
jgi:hypothetical protein